MSERQYESYDQLKTRLVGIRASMMNLLKLQQQQAQIIQTRIEILVHEWDFVMSQIEICEVRPPEATQTVIVVKDTQEEQEEIGAEIRQVLDSNLSYNPPTPPEREILPYLPEYMDRHPVWAGK